ncbi:MAG: hypothetical protein WEH44_08640, partial [Pirellulaceae bacterium]
PMNTRSDYLIVIPTHPPPSDVVLEFDQRTEPEVGERIWLPDKDSRLDRGYRLVEGTVSQVKYEYIEVRLDEAIKPQSQSGSPFISQITGKVLGSWAAGKRDGQKIYIYLTPAHAILNAASRASSHPPLKEVVGKSTGQRAK